MEPIIKKLSESDVLAAFHNKHLEQKIAAEINIIVFEETIKTDKDGLKAIVGVNKTVIGMNEKGNPMYGDIPVKAGDALLGEKENLANIEKILKAIETLEEKTKTNNA